MKRSWLTLATLLAATLACSPPPSTNRPVVIGVLADIQSWNPYLTESQFSEDLLALVYPSLAVEQTDYQDHPPTFAPSLAESWDRGADGLSLTVHLRSNAVWSDGVPVTAQDVVFTWQTQTSPEVGWYASYTKDDISTVEAVDDHTVVFTFTHDYPYQLMDANEGLIIPVHLWSSVAVQDWPTTDWLPLAVAAGPFKPGRHVAQQEIVLERNPTYWKSGSPKVDQVVWRIVPDQIGLLTQLRSGDLDFINRVPPESVERIAADPAVKMVEYRDRAYTHVCWNLDRPLFSDPSVRRALSSAIDRQAIIAVVFRGQAQVSIGPVLSSMWAFNRSLDPPAFDPELARRTLEASGWIDTDGDGVREKDGRRFSFELLTNAESSIRRDLSVVLAEQFAAVGVEAVPRGVEWGSLLSRLETGDFDASINRWVEPTRIDLEDVWHTPPPGEATSNYGRYSNPEVDRLLEEAASESKLANQKPLFDRIQELIVADQPYAFLVESHRIAAMSARLRDARPNDATPYFNLEEWWVEPVD